MNHSFKLVLTVSAISFLSGCGGDISGKYGGKECLYKMEFKRGGTVYITWMGTEVSGEYKVDGDKVSISAGGQGGLVFTKNGNDLESRMMGNKIVCSKQ